VAGRLLTSARGRLRVQTLALALSSAALLHAAPAVAAPNKIDATGATGLTAVEGVSAGPAIVATFTEQNALGAAALTATIDWGDGSSSAGNVAPSGAAYAVSGEHAYAEEGAFPVTVTITDAVNNQATANTTITVADAPLQAVAHVLPRIVAGQPTDQLPLVYFTDPDPSGTPTDYQATVDWGDGSAPEAGTVVAIPGGAFGVTGAHTFAASGPDRITITITDAGGATTQIRERAHVAPSGARRINARFSGRFGFFRRATRILALTAHHVPPGATLVIRCSGPGCFKGQAVVTANRRTVKLTGLFRGLILGPGARVTIEIDKPGFAGADYGLQIRRHMRPRIHRALT
jgi:PKD domain